MLRTRATNAGTSPRADAETQALSLIPVTRRTRLTTKLRRVSLKEGDGESVAGVREPSNIWKADLGKVKGFIPEPWSSSGTPAGEAPIKGAVGTGQPSHVTHRSALPALGPGAMLSD